jgi:uncharacterized membrane protein
MNIALSLVVLTAIALVLGAIVLLRRGGQRKQALLMLVLAAVMIGNVVIATLPMTDGQSPSGAAGKP